MPHPHRRPAGPADGEHRADQRQAGVEGLRGHGDGVAAPQQLADDQRFVRPHGDGPDAGQLALVRQVAVELVIAVDREQPGGAGQFGQLHLRPAGQRVIGCEHDKNGFGADDGALDSGRQDGLPAGEVHVQGQVHGAVGERGEHRRLPVHHRQVHHVVGAHRADDVAEAGGQRRLADGQPQRARTGAVAEVAYGAVQFLQRAEHVAHVRQQDVAERRGVRAMPAAVDEGAADGALDPPHLCRQRRLRHAPGSPPPW